MLTKSVRHAHPHFEAARQRQARSRTVAIELLWGAIAVTGVLYLSSLFAAAV